MSAAAAASVLGLKMGAALCDYLAAAKQAGTLPDVIVTDGLTSVSIQRQLNVAIGVMFTCLTHGSNLNTRAGAVTGKQQPQSSINMSCRPGQPL